MSRSDEDDDDVDGEAEELIQSRQLLKDIKDKEALVARISNNKVFRFIYP